MSSHELPGNTPEVATISDLQPALEAIEKAVFLRDIEKSYRPPTETFGESYVNDRRVLYVAEQPYIALDEVAGVELQQRVPAADVALLGIGSDQLVSLAFSSECYEKDEKGEFRLCPAQAQLLVATAHPDKHETRAYGIELNRLDPSLLALSANSSYSVMYERLDTPHEQEEAALPFEPDPVDGELHLLLNPDLPTGGRVEGIEETSEARKDHMANTVATSRALTPAEAKAVQSVASRFNQ